MPVIRKPNFSDETWDVKMNKIPLVVGNENEDKTTKLKSVTLDEYLKNFTKYTSQKIDKEINLLRDNDKDSHVIMSSQACFLPVPKGEETKFNVALYNYQSQKNNPAVLVIVCSAKGTSAQIIEGTDQKLLFNNNGIKADFLAQRLTDNRKERNVNVQGEMSKQEKQQNLILIIQVPLKRKQINYRNNWSNQDFLFDDDEEHNDLFQLESKMMFNSYSKSVSVNKKKSKSRKKEKSDVEHAIVKIAPKLIPVCKCGKELTKMKAFFAYQNSGVSCDGCSKSCDKNDFIWHCPNEKNHYLHKDGYDLCFDCGNNQLKFKELNELTSIERDDKYPVRVTLQYYKSTSNGVVDSNIMFQISSQLINSKKQSDFCGSLVVDKNTGKRPTEWTKKEEPKNNGNSNQYFQIQKILEKLKLKDRFFENFKKEEMTDDVILLLDSKDDLKDVINTSGPRIKVWKEIEKFKKLMKEKENQQVDWVEELGF